MTSTFNPNTGTTQSSISTIFKDSFQQSFFKKSASAAISDTNFDSTIKRVGDRVSFPIISAMPAMRTLATSTSKLVTMSLDSTSEQLVIQYAEYLSIFLERNDNIQGSNLSIPMVTMRQMLRRAKERMDANVLSEIANFGITFDTGTLTTRTPNGVPLVITASNAPTVFARLRGFLEEQDLTEGGGEMVTIITALAKAAANENIITRQADVSVNYMINGVPGTTRSVTAEEAGVEGQINGASVYVSTNLPTKQVINFASNPANNSVFSIGSVDFTFVTTLVPTTANQIKIGANVAATLASVVALLTAIKTANTASELTGSADYTFVSDVASVVGQLDNLSKMRNFSLDATVVGSDLTLVGKGGSKILSVPAGATVIKNAVLAYFGYRKTVKVAIQDDMYTETFKAQDQFGEGARLNMLMGTKVFSHDKNNGIIVELDATVM
jgi:hypothetical protein